MLAHQLVAPRTFLLREVEIPKPADLPGDEILVEMEIGGICGSDLPFFAGIDRESASHVGGDDLSNDHSGIPLHEILGKVVSMGSNSDLKIGDRVVGWATEFNGLAQFVATKSNSVIPIGYDQEAPNAIGLQPLACVLQAVDRLETLENKTFTVFGLGPIGALFVHVLRSSGAGRIIGIDRVDRSGLPDQFRPDEFFQMSTRSWAGACEVKPELRSDFVVDAIGHQPGVVDDAIEAINDGGTFYLFGIPDESHYVFPIEKFLRKNGSMHAGVMGVEDRRRWLRAAAVYSENHPELLADYVTDLLPFEQANAAYELAANPRPGQMKIAIDIQPTQH